MAFQHQVIDTIVAMKAALQRRGDTSDSDDSNSDDRRPLNLKRKQRYTRHGHQGDAEAPPAWKRKVDHAGYSRYVINRNSPRFDIDGDIVPPLDDDDENDIEYQDWTDVENNIYAGIDLEEIFAPLTSASALPEHQALSLPYTSKHLTNLTEDAAKLVRKEQVALWKAKSIMLKLRGDMSWVPCGVMETSYDKYIKGDRQVNGVVGASSVNGTHHGHGNGQASTEDSTTTAKLADATTASTSRTVDDTTHKPQTTSQNRNATRNRDIEMLDQLVSERDSNHGRRTSDGKSGSSLQTNGDGPAVATNGDYSHATNGSERDAKPKEAAAKAETNGDAPWPNPPVSPDGSSDGSSQPMAHRMTTRAKAQEEAAVLSNPLSPPSNTIHPFFNFPPAILPDPDFGLPPSEAEETRALLLAFVQKHEEIVRNATELHHEMLNAESMRKEVFKWCKADGHVGEMSDGEDWYDESEWGLDGPLVKGRDEEEEAQTGDVGKKTRQRRGREER